MTSIHERYGDPLACRATLRDALQELSRAGPDSAAAWCAVAIALGRCRLFGVEPGPDLDGTLTVPQSRLAAAGLIEALHARTGDARTLGERWDQTVDPEEGLELVASLLEDRMDAWAGLVTLEEATEAGVADRASGLEELAADYQRGLDALDALDEALEEHLDLLSIVCETPILDHWRACLAPEFAAEEPWWLDGRLEAAAGKVSTLASAWSPSPAQLARLRRQLQPQWPGGFPQASLPTLRSLAPLAAASTTPAAVPLPGRVLCWLSPEGLYRAELRLPTWSDPAQEQLARPVTFTTRADDEPAVTLDGQPVRLGNLDAVLERACFRVSLEQLRQAGTLCLLVGEPATEWTAVEPDEKQP